MANLEIIALNTSTPQLLAPQAGDGYKATLTWNNVATTYTGMLFDLTNTASASGSTILDMKVGGSSVFNVTPSTANPGLTITNSSAATLFSVSNTTIVGTRTVQLTPSANTSALTVGSFALSGANAQSILDLAGTWNTSGTPTAIKLNVTDTASNAASLLLDLQTGGTSRFLVAKGGRVDIQDSLRVFGTGSVRIINNTGSFQLGAADDLILSRKAAANLQLGAADAAAPVAQTLSVQSVVAGTTNTAGVDFNIRASAGTGSGAGGRILFFTAAAGASGTAQNAFTERLRIEQDGNLMLSPTVRSYYFTSANFFMRSTASIISMGTDGNFANPDLDLRRIAAGILRLSQNGTNIGGALELLEQTAPAAPAANQVRIYAEDDGAGKTRLMALFATGAAQQIAIEP